MFRKLISNQKYVVAAVYVCAMILNSLDATIVNVTLSTLGREFGVQPSEIEVVIVAYLVSLAVVMPASGWLTDRFGARRVFLAALAIYTLTSVLCGFAQTLEQLTLFRVMQGLGGGLLVPVGMALLFRTFPPSERIGVGRVLMFATILGPALGPLVGGAILQIATWPWTFWAKVPVSTAALLFGWRYLIEEPADGDAGRLDWLGFALSGIGMGSGMYAMLQGPDAGWTSPRIILFGGTGLAALALFVWHEMRTSAPMVDLRLLSDRLMSACIRVSFFATAGFLGTLFLVPLFLQDVRGFSPFEAGLATMPEAIGVVVSTQIVARIYPSIGPRRLMSGSLLFVAITIVLLSRMNTDTPMWLVQIVMFGIGFGMAGVFLPNQAASMATIPRAKLGGASMLFTVQRQVGSAFGVAMLSTMLSVIGVFTSSGEPNLTAWRLAFMLAAVFSVIGSIMGLSVPDEDAAETMNRRGAANVS